MERRRWAVRWACSFASALTISTVACGDDDGGRVDARPGFFDDGGMMASGADAAIDAMPEVDAIPTPPDAATPDAPVADAPSADAESPPPIDAAPADAPPADAATPDAPAADAPPPPPIDAAVADAPVADAPVVDAFVADAMLPDAMLPDAMLPDARLPDASPDAMPLSCPEPDGFEDNDVSAAAAPIAFPPPPVIPDLSVRDTDEDWYAITVDPLCMLTIIVCYDPAFGEVGLEVDAGTGPMPGTPGPPCGGGFDNKQYVHPPMPGLTNLLIRVSMLVPAAGTCYSLILDESCPPG